MLVVCRRGQQCTVWRNINQGDAGVKLVDVASCDFQAKVFLCLFDRHTDVNETSVSVSLKLKTVDPSGPGHLIERVLSR